MSTLKHQRCMVCKSLVGCKGTTFITNCRQLVHTSCIRRFRHCPCVPCMRLRRHRNNRERRIIISRAYWVNVDFIFDLNTTKNNGLQHKVLFCKTCKESIFSGCITVCCACGLFTHTHNLNDYKCPQCSCEML